MREIRLSGSEGGGTGNSTGPPYPYPLLPDVSVGAGHARDCKATVCNMVVFARTHAPAWERRRGRSSVRFC